MAKQAKLPQTQWTTAGRDISNTAAPLYQSNLQRMDTYLSDPQAALDSYLNKYYGANAIQNQDMLRAYNRAMGNQVGRNYAATGGGYSTSGQRAWNDQQSTWNDLVARLQQYGVGSAYDMSNRDYQNMLAANSAYHNAYGLGQNYSNIEQQNALADQQNKNWFSSALSGLGNAAMAIAPFTGVAAPFVAGAGALASGAGGATALDTSNAMNTMASIYGGQGVQPVTSNNTYTNIANQLGQFDWGKVRNSFDEALKRRMNTGVANTNAQTGLNLRGIR